MGKPFKDKLKNVGDFISGTIAEVEKQAKDSEVLEKISKGTKDGLVFVSNGVKDGAEKITNGAKTSADTIKNVVAEHKKQGIQDNNKEKQGSLDDQLHDAVNRYNAAYAEFENNGSAILRQRERSVDLLENVENLVNSIANHPKNFDADFKEIQLYKKEFKDVCDYATQELDAAKKSMAGVGAGVAGGMAVASLAPSAAMWVATTFGTASTGTAISTLSGAAAANAALAWLGGGAAAAGGGGMASGTAFLAMAGPVGWTIGGATLLASIALFANKKIKLGKEKKEEIEAVLHNVELVSEVNVKMQSLLDKTDKLRSMLNDQYGNCMTYYGKNFIEIVDEGQMLLGTLVNNAKSLAATLTTVIGWYKHATVYRHYQEAVFAPEDIQYYNAIAKSSDCVLLPTGTRARKVQWEVPRKSSGWAYGFGRANVWYASEEDSRLQDYLARLEKQINEYDGENWIEKYAE